MLSIASFKTTLNVNVLFRKKSVDRIAFGLKTILLLGIFCLLVIGVIEIFDSSLNAVFERVDVSSAPTIEEPQGDQTGEQRQYAEIATRSVFGQLGVVAAPAATPKVEKPVANVPLTLLGTYVSSDDSPFAIIEHTGKKSEDAFSIGDSIFGEAKLAAVYADRVEIDRSGQIEILKLEDTSSKDAKFKDGVATVGTDEYVVEESEINKALENLPLLLTQARAVPYFKDGKAVGLRLFAIKNGSLFEKIGLQNGDILKAVNGASLSDMGEAVKLFEKLKSEREIGVSLERNLEPKEFKYSIR